MLALTAAIFGEFRGFHIQAVSRGAWFALAYLIVAGSIIGFTAYVWLIHHESPTKVGTYAYVNPVVAVLLGWAFAGETLSLRTMVAAAVIVAAVIMITTHQPRAEVRATVEKEADATSRFGEREWLESGD